MEYRKSVGALSLSSASLPNLYKALIHKEMLFIRKNKNKIIQNAKILYKQKKENNPAIGYLKSTVDFSLLEQMHDKFIEKKNN